MLIDKQSQSLADKVYTVDSKKRVADPPEVREAPYLYNDEDPSLGAFKVLKIADNPDNGMQAMAIAPIVNGVVDEKNITIVYAGTNMADSNDLLTDGRQVLWGSRKLIKAVYPAEHTHPIKMRKPITKVVDDQLDTAMQFAEEVQQEHPKAYISYAGHSLGGFIAMYVAAKHRASVVAFNGPEAFIPQLSESERKWIIENTDIFIDYRNSRDFIGGWGKDELGIVRLSEYGDATQGELNKYVWALFEQYHGVLTWPTDRPGNIVSLLGVPLNKNYVATELDIDGDGEQDIKLTPSQFYTRNLLSVDSSKPYTFNYDKTIKIDAENLHQFAHNINISVLEDLALVRSITEKCRVKNNSIKGSFDERKETVTEELKATFSKTALLSVFEQLEGSLKKVIDQAPLFDSLATLKTLKYPFSSVEKPDVNGTTFNSIVYNSELGTLARSAMNIPIACHSEKITGGFTDINGRDSILKMWQKVDEASRHLVEKSDTLFEGTGLREGKPDGISASLKEVFDVQIPDIDELAQMISNLSALVSGVATNFTEMDTWISNNIQNGTFQGSADTISVPATYEAYLERIGILDDVKDVLQAFDKQVEKRSKEYTTDVSEVYSEVFSSLDTSLRQWHLDITQFKNIAKNVSAHFSDSVYVTDKIMIDNQMKEQRTYWGSLKSLYPMTVQQGVIEVEAQVTPLIAKIGEATQTIRITKSNIQDLQDDIYQIVEKGVYTALDLDEIMARQKVARQLVHKMVIELTDAQESITAEMSGMAAEALITQLQAVISRLNYYGQVISDCFGENTFIRINGINKLRIKGE